MNEVHTLAHAVKRLDQIERQIADGRWSLSTDTIQTVLRHTVGIVMALQSAVVVGVEASS